MITLEIKNLSCRYNDESVLSNLSLALEDNEIVCLLGASGCGKTTLLKAIAGLIEAKEGSVVLMGNDITDRPIEHREVGMIFQDYALFPHLTVKENIAFGLRKMNPSDREARIKDMMSLVHLEGLEDRYPHELSGGQQQRVSIARALAYEPKCLLLDEPFSNIDSQVRTQLISEMRGILKARNIPAIFVTHSKDEAFVFADRLAILNQGQIVQMGSAQSLYHEPCNAFVAEFMGAVNYLPIEVKDGVWMTAIGPVPEAKCGCVFTPGMRWLLRPEDLRLDPDDEGPGVIEEKVFHGSFNSYIVRLPNDLRLNIHQDESWAVGTKVRVSMKPYVGSILMPE